MHRLTYRLIGAATLLIAMATLALAPAATATGQAMWIDVLSVKIDANGLIIIVCRDIGDVLVADGTHQGRGVGVVFKDGAIVSVTGRNAFDVERVSIGDIKGEIALYSPETASDKASPYILPDGDYRLEGRLGREQTRRPLVTGFRIRSGAIASALPTQ